MRVVIAIEEKGPNEFVAERFGTCTKFVVCELDSDKYLVKTETYFNPFAGENNDSCQLPEYIKQFKVDAIITGEIKQKVADIFINNNIDVISLPGKTFQETLSRFAARQKTSGDGGYTD